jgi:nascent polypeptide-associated complex subunit alpha
MGGRMDPRRMNQMMKQLGIDVVDVDDVQEVIIRTPTKDIVFDAPSVTIMTAQGQKTYQVVGNPKTVQKGAAAPGKVAPAPAQTAPTPPPRLEITQEDIDLVAAQSGKKPSDARKALEQTNGDIAEAILKLTGG